MSGKAGYAYNAHAQVSKMFTKIFKTEFFVAPIKKKKKSLLKLHCSPVYTVPKNYITFLTK